MITILMNKSIFEISYNKHQLLCTIKNIKEITKLGYLLLILTRIQWKIII